MRKLTTYIMTAAFIFIIASFFFSAEDVGAGNPPSMWQKAFSSHAVTIWVSDGDSVTMLEGTGDGALLAVMQGYNKKTKLDSVTVDGTETESKNFSFEENSGIYGIFVLIDSLGGTLGKMTITVANYYFGAASYNTVTIGNMNGATITDGRLFSDQLFIEPGGDSIKVNVSGNGTGDSWEAKIGIAYY